MLTKEIEEYMMENGWVFESYSPLEIRNGDSFASNMAARIVTDFYRKELEIAEGVWD